MTTQDAAAEGARTRLATRTLKMRKRGWGSIKPLYAAGRESVTAPRLADLLGSVQKPGREARTIALPAIRRGGGRALLPLPCVRGACSNRGIRLGGRGRSCR